MRGVSVYIRKSEERKKTSLERLDSRPTSLLSFCFFQNTRRIQLHKQKAKNLRRPHVVPKHRAGPLCPRVNTKSAYRKNWVTAANKFPYCLWVCVFLCMRTYLLGKIFQFFQLHFILRCRHFTIFLP